MGGRKKGYSKYSSPHVPSGVGGMSWDRRGSGSAGDPKPNTTLGQVNRVETDDGVIYQEPYDLWKAREKKAGQSLPRKTWTKLSAVQSYLASVKK